MLLNVLNEKLTWKYKLYFAVLGNCLTKEETMLLVNSVDRDGDGVLDFEEFVKIMMARDEWQIFNVFI